jgi:predicted DNA-binding transcriptional regulator YafY
VRFPPRDPPAKDVAKYVAERLSAAPTRYEARVTVHAPADAIRPRIHWGTVEPIDDRTCEYRTGDDNLNWLTMRVAMLDVDFEVHEPPELIERLGAMADRLRQATGAQ